MSEELRPCPFCERGGGCLSEKMILRGGKIITVGYYIRCNRRSTCGAMGPIKKTMAAAIRAWNRRPHRE